ncbi:MAG: toxin TcdB middle/C-terminal domain-containing protein, partial [Chitinivibrionales bacterium]
MQTQNRPYTVSEKNYTIKRFQPINENRHACFYTHERESIEFNYERKLYNVGGEMVADPRTRHSFVLAFDNYGNEMESVSVAYGRRHDNDSLNTEEQRLQSENKVVYNENKYTNEVDTQHLYRLPSPWKQKTWEIGDCEVPEDGLLFSFEEVKQIIENLRGGANEVPYEDVNGDGSSGAGPYRRFIRNLKTLYRSDDLEEILPTGQLESLGLPGEKFSYVFTPGLLQNVFIDSGKTTPDEIESALSYSGYFTTAQLQAEGLFTELDDSPGWWQSTGKVFYSTDETHTPAQERTYAYEHFFLPHRYADPFSNSTKAIYDDYDLLILQVEDALHNKTTAGEREESGAITHVGIDYRVVQPYLVTDANGNRSAVVYDILGLVAGTAFMGKSGEVKGDSLTGFTPDLDDSTIIQHLQNPLQSPLSILGSATSRFVYDFWAFHRSSEAPVVYTLDRETHVSDLAPGSNTQVQHTFEYSDGFGRVIQ